MSIKDSILVSIISLDCSIGGETYLGECTVVPKVALVGEAVADEAELSLLGVLLDGVKSLLLGDLYRHESWLAFRLEAKQSNVAESRQDASYLIG